MRAPYPTPEGWDAKPLADLAEVVSGVTKGRKLDPSKMISVPYLRVANVNAGELELSEIKEIDVLQSDIDKYRLQAGDVLMTEGGDPDKLGRGAMWDGSVDPCIHQNHIFRVRVDRTRIMPEFLVRFLGTREAKGYFLKAAKQTTGIATINSRQLKAFPILLPSLSEQRRIAAILDKADSIRRKRQETIRLTEEFLRSVFLDMFGDPVTNPKGWPVSRMDELGRVNRGKFTPRPRNDPRYYGGEHPFIQTGDLSHTNGILKTWKQTLNDDGIKVSRRFPRGTIAAAIAANIGDTAILGFDSYFPDSVVGIEVFANRGTAEYVEFWLRFQQQTLTSRAPETAQKNFNLQVLRPLRVACPPLDHQRLFAALYNKACTLIDSQHSAANQEDALFGSLVNRVFQGRI